jgi:DNA modification methylase
VSKFKKKPVIAPKKANSIFQALSKELARPDTSNDINASFNDPDAKPKKPFTLDISKLLERANI